MTDRQRDKLNMYVLVKDFLLASATITNRWNVFANLFTGYTDIVTQIFTISGQQNDDNTGITKQKSQVQLKLIEIIEDISAKCKAYATVAEDLAFLSLIKFSRGPLLRMADADLVKTAETFHANVLPKFTQVADYDLTQAELDELILLKDAFLAIYTKPRGKKKESKVLTTSLDSLFAKADKILLKLDALVQSVQKKEPEFVEAYFNKRVITKTASRTRAMQLSVLNDATGEALPNARISIAAKSGADLTKVVKRSGKQGSITTNNLPDGEYQYTVEYNGLQKETGTFFVNAGTTTRVEVRMKKSE